MASMWLECNAEQGMLGDELAVSVETETGTVSLFVPRAVVREKQGGRKAIAVRQIDEDQSFRLVELPQPPIDGSRVVKVKRSQVST